MTKAKKKHRRPSLRAVMSYEEALRRVNRLADGLNYPVDPKIKPLVTIMIMCGIKTRMSCEGHLGRGRSHPWVTVELGQEDKLNCLLGWQNRPRSSGGGINHNLWVLESHPHGWCIVPQKLDRPLRTLQRYAFEFAERIRHMLDISRN